jgi:CRP-like cAMP-binding protein
MVIRPAARDASHQRQTGQSQLGMRIADLLDIGGVLHRCPPNRTMDKTPEANGDICMIESKYLEENDKLLKSLKSIPSLDQFKTSELRLLLRKSKIQKYRKGERIIREGSTGAWIYILVYGRVDIVKDGRVITTTDRRGELIGEISAVDGAARSASVMASDDTVCLATDTRQIERLSGNDRLAFGYILYRVFAETLAERLRVTTAELIRKQSRFRLPAWLPQGARR